MYNLRRQHRLEPGKVLQGTSAETATAREAALYLLAIGPRFLHRSRIAERPWRYPFTRNRKEITKWPPRKQKKTRRNPSVSVALLATL